MAGGKSESGNWKIVKDRGVGRRIFLLALHRTHGRIEGTREVVIALLPYLVGYRVKEAAVEGCGFFTRRRVGRNG